MGRPPRKKNDIERAALELFAELGVDGTSIRMIAERAGVTEGALYRHHSGKDELVRALFVQYFEHYARMLEEARTAGGTIGNQLERMIAGFYAAYDADPQGFWFVLMVQHDLLDRIRHAKEGPNVIEVIMGVLREAMHRGEIPRGDVSLLAQMLLGLVTQVAVGHRYGRVAGPIAPLAPRIAAACLCVLREGA